MTQRPRLIWLADAAVDGEFLEPCVDPRAALPSGSHQLADRAAVAGPGEQRGPQGGRGVVVLIYRRRLVRVVRRRGDGVPGERVELRPVRGVAGNECGDVAVVVLYARARRGVVCSGVEIRNLPGALSRCSRPSCG